MERKDPAAVSLGRKGGLARAKKLSADERSKIASKAVAAREAKRKQKRAAQGTEPPTRR